MYNATTCKVNCTCACIKKKKIVISLTMKLGVVNDTAVVTVHQAE